MYCGDGSEVLDMVVVDGIQCFGLNVEAVILTQIKHQAANGGRVKQRDVSNRVGAKCTGLQWPKWTSNLNLTWKGGGKYRGVGVSVRASCTAGAPVVAPHQGGLAHVCGHALSAPNGRLGCWTGEWWPGMCQHLQEGAFFRCALMVGFPPHSEGCW